MAERIIRTGERMKQTRLSRAAVVLAFCVMTLALLSCGGEQEASQKTDRTVPAVTVRAELLIMMTAEQQARDEFDSIVAEFGWRTPQADSASAKEVRVDRANQARLKEIVTEFGWPGRSLVGDEAALGAFLILQHAELSVQQEYLPLFKAAANEGEVPPMHLAMVQDRVLMRQGEDQIYGTQMWNDPSTGELGLYPVRDSANVDIRRDSVGLGPIRDYLLSFGIDPDTMTTESPYEIHVTPTK